MGTDQEYSFPLQWTAKGTAETTWKIPENAKLGTYRTFLLQKRDKSVRRKVVWNTGSFEVQEFRIPLMRASVKGPKEPVINAKDVDVDISLTYLSGGGASFAPVKTRSAIRPRFINLEAYSEYMF